MILRFSAGLFSQSNRKRLSWWWITRRKKMRAEVTKPWRWMRECRSAFRYSVPCKRHVKSAEVESPSLLHKQLPRCIPCTTENRIGYGKYLPSMIISGAQKGGISFMLHLLAQHPGKVGNLISLTTALRSTMKPWCWIHVKSVKNIQGTEHPMQNLQKQSNLPWQNVHLSI